MLALVAMLWLAAGSGTTSRTAHASIKPQQLNVMLVTADDLGLQVGAYGEKLIRTPNIDALATSGARLEVAYVAAPSGKYPRTCWVSRSVRP